MLSLIFLLLITACSTYLKMNIGVISQSALELGHSYCPNGRLGQDLGLVGFAFALKLPELLNTNLPTVREKLGQTCIVFPEWSPNLVPNNAINLGAQLRPVSITKLSPNWACQMGPIHLIKFLLSGEFMTYLWLKVMRKGWKSWNEWVGSRVVDLYRKEVK